MKINKRPTQDFLKSGDYLPKLLQDGYDQKNIFSFLDGHIDRDNKDHLIKLPNWVSAQAYVIDVFLWIMARYGYTLQKSRKHIEFLDLEEALQVRHSQLIKQVMRNIKEDIRRELND